MTGINCGLTVVGSVHCRSDLCGQ